TFEDKEHHEAPYDYLNDEPADGLVSTAMDMSHLVIANLQQGKYNGKQILKPSTIELMQRQHFTHHPKLSGWCFGWYEDNRPDLRILIHDGTVAGFTSRVCIVPGTNFGFVLCTNMDVATGNMVPSFTSRIIDYFFGGETNTDPDPPADFAQRAHQYEGY